MMSTTFHTVNTLQVDGKETNEEEIMTKVPSVESCLHVQTSVCRCSGNYHAWVGGNCCHFLESYHACFKWECP